MNTSKKQQEESLSFTPKFDKDGLIPCITTSAKTGTVLMFAWMNEQALQKTIETGEAHYFSRSRNELWHKGASSGLTQKVTEMRIDCDHDCILLKVEIPGEEASCHTGRHSCFYRAVPVNTDANTVQLKFIDAEKIFDPDEVYKE